MSFSQRMGPFLGCTYHLKTPNEQRRRTPVRADVRKQQLRLNTTFKPKIKLINCFSFLIWKYPTNNQKQMRLKSDFLPRLSSSEKNSVFVSARKQVVLRHVSSNKNARNTLTSVPCFWQPNPTRKWFFLWLNWVWKNWPTVHMSGEMKSTRKNGSCSNEKTCRQLGWNASQNLLEWAQCKNHHVYIYIYFCLHHLAAHHETAIIPHATFQSHVNIHVMLNWSNDSCGRVALSLFVVWDLIGWVGRALALGRLPNRPTEELQDHLVTKKWTTDSTVITWPHLMSSSWWESSSFTEDLQQSPSDDLNKVLFVFFEGFQGT